MLSAVFASEITEKVSFLFAARSCGQAITFEYSYWIISFPLYSIWEKKVIWDRKSVV